jgi:DNA-binding response OmpR family regulator
MEGALAGKTVMIVDDDPDIVTTIKSSLTELGSEVMTAANGNDAVLQAQQQMPDLIVLDQMLPGRSGLLVLEKLKRGKKRSEPPRIIMITGNPGSRHKMYAQSLGVDAYLNKPFRMEKLVDQVTKLLVQTDDGKGCSSMP